MSSTCYCLYISTSSTVQSPLLLNLPSSSSYSGLLPVPPEFRVSFSSRCHYSPRGPRSFQFPSKKLGSFEVRASAAESEQPKWWEKTGGPNMVDIHSTQDLLGALSQAGDRLVIVEFYGTWCASCRALFPKLCKTAEENPDILFLKVNFDENKSLCKSLNVKVLPYFHFYRGADGLLQSFSCSLAKYQKIKDAIAIHKPSSCDAISLKEKTSDTSPR